MRDSGRRPAVALGPQDEAAAAGGADQEARTPHAGMMRTPDISASHVVFAYANDLWVVPREGGTAMPLSSPAGAESFPRFSSDGRRIAFMGNYEGNVDLYVIPTLGGAAERVTYHSGAEVLCDWTPEGELLYFTNALSFSRRVTELFTVPATGGPSTKVPRALRSEWLPQRER